MGRVTTAGAAEDQEALEHEDAKPADGRWGCWRAETYTVECEPWVEEHMPES